MTILTCERYPIFVIVHLHLSVKKYLHIGKWFHIFLTSTSTFQKDLFNLSMLQPLELVHSAGAIEYTYCNSADG